MDVDEESVRSLKVVELRYINLEDIVVKPVKLDLGIADKRFFGRGDSAISATHSPSGISITSHKHRSQWMNRNRALMELNNALEAWNEQKS